MKRDYTSILSRLGVVSDAELARELGCLRCRVYYLRTKLGIPSVQSTRRVDIDRLLGHYTDTEIARAVGLSRRAITDRRRRLKIPRADVKAAHRRHLFERYVHQLNMEA